MKNLLKEIIFLIYYFVCFFVLRKYINVTIEEKQESKELTFREKVNYLCEEYKEKQSDGAFLYLFDLLKNNIMTYKPVYYNIQMLLKKGYIEKNDYLQTLRIGILEGIMNRDEIKGDYYTSIFNFITKELRRLEYSTSKECLSVKKCEIIEGHNVKYEDEYEKLISQDELKEILFSLVETHKYKDALYYYIIGNKKKAREINKGVNFKQILEQLVFTNKELFYNFL